MKLTKEEKKWLDEQTKNYKDNKEETLENLFINFNSIAEQYINSPQSKAAKDLFETAVKLNKEFIEKMLINQNDIYEVYSEANKELKEINKALELASNNDNGCEIHIGDLKIGLCNNKTIIEALEHNKKEINKFLNGLPNEWEL